MSWSTISDAFNYLTFNNPVSKSAISLSKSALNTIYQPKDQSAVLPNIIINQKPLYELAVDQGPFVRIAGACGALAVALGAYGAHKSYPKDRAQELKAIYETGNRMHLIHSVALLGTPLCRNPKLSGSFFLLGMTLFCGPCYIYAFTGENKFGKLAPLGGFCFILGWLAMIK